MGNGTNNPIVPGTKPRWMGNEGVKIMTLNKSALPSFRIGHPESVCDTGSKTFSSHTHTPKSGVSNDPPAAVAVCPPVWAVVICLNSFINFNYIFPSAWLSSDGRRMSICFPPLYGGNDLKLIRSRLFCVG